jgi:hypothetical protein
MAKTPKNKLEHINNQSIYAYNYVEIKKFDRFLGQMVTTNLAVKQAVEHFNIKN